MEDQRVGRAGPTVGRRSSGACRRQLLFDGDRVVRSGDAEPVRHAQDVAIDREARDAQGMAQHDVRGLAPDAWERHERVHVGWHVAGVTRDKCSRCAHEVPGFHPVEAGWLDEGLEILGLGFRQRRGIRVVREERRRDLVHAAVRALRGEDRRGEQFEWRSKVEFGRGVGVLRFQAIEDGVATAPERGVRGDTIGDAKSGWVRRRARG